MTLLRVGRILHGTVAEGPGLRTAVSVQGCSIRCRGCINPHLFSMRGGTDVEVDLIIRDALEAGVEGLTVIGGEPFDQPSGVGDLAEKAQEAGLGVIMFSGYQLEDLSARGVHESRALAATDLLVDGPYDASNPEEERSLIGSANQRFIHLTNRYASFDPARHRNRVDVRVRPDGTIDVAGFLDTAGLNAFAEAASSRRHLSARIIDRG